MSDTPRTDKETFPYPVPYKLEGGPVKFAECVAADFARQLERENAKLKADAERYRWLRDQGVPELCVVRIVAGQQEPLYDSRLDAVIDSARKGNTGGIDR